MPGFGAARAARKAARSGTPFGLARFEQMADSSAPVLKRSFGGRCSRLSAMSSPLLRMMVGLRRRWASKTMRFEWPAEGCRAGRLTRGAGRLGWEPKTMAYGEHALDGGRASFERYAWADAHALLSAADKEAPLGLDDLERLAMAAYLVGRDAESTDIWARAHHECVRLGDPVGAARCALRLGTGLLLMGEMAQGGGWLARARRIIEEGDLDCVERGWLLVPAAVQCFDDDPTTAHVTFGQAAEIGRASCRERV